MRKIPQQREARKPKTSKVQSAAPSKHAQYQRVSRTQRRKTRDEKVLEKAVLALNAPSSMSLHVASRMAEQRISRPGKSTLDELAKYYDYDNLAREIHKKELDAVKQFGRNPKRVIRELRRRWILSNLKQIKKQFELRLKKSKKFMP